MTKSGEQTIDCKGLAGRLRAGSAALDGVAEAIADIGPGADAVESLLNEVRCSAGRSGWWPL